MVSRAKWCIPQQQIRDINLCFPSFISTLRTVLHDHPTHPHALLRPAPPRTSDHSPRVRIHRGPRGRKSVHRRSAVMEGEEIERGTKSLPLYRAACRVNKTRIVAREPLPAFAMLDTCFSLEREQLHLQLHRDDLNEMQAGEGSVYHIHVSLGSDRGLYMG